MRLVDFNTVQRTSWVMVGAWNSTRLQGGLALSTYTNKEIKALPAWGTTAVVTKKAWFQGSAPLPIGSFLDELGGMIIPERLNRSGSLLSTRNIVRIFTAIEHLKIDEYPEHKTTIKVNPSFPNISVKEFKEREDDTKRDIALHRWGGIVKETRSRLFMEELKKSNRDLWWFQLFFSQQIFTLGDRAKHFKECSGACDLCPDSEANYSHVFLTCSYLHHFIAHWRSRSPLITWRADWNDWIGIPSASYDNLPGRHRKAVLEWLMQAVAAR
jgi:hypothetical protein